MTWLPNLRSIKTIFLGFSIFLVAITSLPITITGYYLLTRIVSNLETNIIQNQLSTVLSETTRRYDKLKQFGLEDSYAHKKEIFEAGVRELKKLSYKQTGRAFVIGQDKTIYLSNEFNQANAPLFQDFFQKLGSSKEDSFTYQPDDRKSSIVFFQYYQPWHCYVGINISEEDFFAQRSLFLKVSLAVLACCISIFVLTMGLFNRFFILPIAMLTGYAQEIAAGNFYNRMEGKFIFELALLKQSLDDMAANIKQKIKETISQLEQLRQKEQERSQAMTALQNSERRLRDILDNSPALIYIKDLQDRYITVNRQFEHIFNLSPEAIRNRSDVEILPTNIANQFRQNNLKVIEQKKPMEFEEVINFKDRQSMTYVSIKFPLKDANNKVYAIANISTDITDRKKAEEAIQAEQERLFVTLKSIGDAVIATDIRGTITLMNKVAEDLTGWTFMEAVQRPLTDIFHIIHQKHRHRLENPVEKVLATGQIQELANHTLLISKSGRECIIADSAAPIMDNKNKIIGAVMVFRDETEKNKLLEDSIKKQKLESVGLLAGGIAHDFNNLLAAMQGNISLLEKECGELHPKTLKYIERFNRAIERATGLTNQLLTFTKGGAPVKTTLSLRDLIKDSAMFVLHGKALNCRFDIKDDLWPCEVDKNQISQVIQNIVINAQQAMNGAGNILIQACNHARNSSTPKNLKGEHFIRIDIEDDGPGISKSVMEKIFDPYFTTKETGSGLGLALSHSIITKHEGHISVRSGSQKGAVFTLYLPAQPTPQAVQSVLHDISATALPVSGKSLNILVMEDETDILETTIDMLMAIGHFTGAAKNGEEAIAKYTEAIKNNTPFDIVIMDQTIIGGMDGQEAAAQILKIDPNARLIASSGYAKSPVMSYPNKYGFVAVLPKPYRLNQLTELFQKIIPPDTQ